MKDRVKALICMILSILSFKFVSLFMHLSYSVLNIPFNNKTNMYQLISGLLVLVIAGVLNYKILINDFKEFKKIKDKGIKLVGGIALFFFLKYILAYIVAFIFIFVGGNIQSDNQAAIETLTHANPFISLLTGVILAPFYEELIFRGSMRTYFKHDILFILTSGLVFGLLHVVNNIIFLLSLVIFFASIQWFIDNKDKKIVSKSIFSFIIISFIFLSLYYINPRFISLGIDIRSLIIQCPLYVMLGGYLAFYYVKYKNIYFNMIVHAGNNLISSLMILF